MHGRREQRRLAGDSHWTVEPAPNPLYEGGGSVISAVSCPSNSACTAVGERGFGNTSTMAEQWDGSLNGSAPALLSLAEYWNGSAWVIRPTPSPDSYTVLTAVGCSSATACTAVGNQGANGPLAERWNGATWSVQATPTQRNAGQGDLFAVSCPSATACFAVGDTASATQFAVLAESWNGTSWTITDVPVPAGSDNPILTGISCTSPTQCTAVGSSDNSAGTARPLVERWNGTKWAVPRGSLRHTLGRHQMGPHEPASKVSTTLRRPSRIVTISIPRATGLSGGPTRHASAAVPVPTYAGPSSSSAKPARGPSRSFCAWSLSACHPTNSPPGSVNLTSSVYVRSMAAHRR